MNFRNQKLYDALWYSNGKSMTIMSYVYIVLGVISLADNLTTALMFAVMAELSKVDKAMRFLATEQAELIINDADNPDKEDEEDD